MSTPHYQFKAENFQKQGVIPSQPNGHCHIARRSSSPPALPPVPSEAPPIYQDVAELPTVPPPSTTYRYEPNGTTSSSGNDGGCGTVNTCSHRNAAETLDSEYSDPAPIYQEIVGGLSLSSFRALSKPHDKVNHMPTAGTGL